MYEKASNALSPASQVSTRPETEIEGVMSRTSNAACRLHSRIDALRERIKPLLAPVGPETQGATGAAPKAVLSPLGEGIRNIEDAIDHAVDRIESMLRDLAL